MKEKQPLVTIAVPSFNHAKFIVETLDSIRHQSYENIELIINDDGSKDGSVEIIEHWMCSNREMNVIFNASKANKGLCASLNFMLNRAGGKYFSAIASDDKYLPDFVSNRVRYLESTDNTVGICYSKTFFIDEQSKRVGVEERSVWPHGWIFEELCGLSNSFCKPFTTMVKREVYDKIGWYDESLIFEDIEFFLRASKRFQIHFIDSVDTEYRVLEDSLGKQLVKPKGLESLSDILHKNMGFSSEADYRLAKRLRKVGIKKLEQGIPSFRKDLIKANSFLKDPVIVLILFADRVGISYKLLKKFRKI